MFPIFARLNVFNLFVMKSIYGVLMIGAVVAACSGKTSGEPAEADSAAVEAVEEVAVVKDESPKVVEVERSANFIPIEGATDEDYEMSTTVTHYTYDEQGRIVKVEYDLEGDDHCTVTFDHSKAGQVVETTRFASGEDAYVNTYYIDKDGYVTKVEGSIGVITFKYKDGRLAESDKDNGDSFITYEWKDGNMVSTTARYSDGYEDVATCTYTDIPLEGNFDYGQNFNWCGLDYVHIVSKGFCSKNYIKTMVNDHPLEDEYAYKQDKDGKVVLVEMGRCSDNYSQDVKVKAIIK